MRLIWVLMMVGLMMVVLISKIVGVCFLFFIFTMLNVFNFV